jgi:proline iminopeptidase
MPAHLCWKVALSTLLVSFASSAVAQSSATQFTFRACDSSLAYDVYGSGRTVVLLGGGPGMNPAYMAPVAQMLAEDGVRVVLFAQRGTGRSAAAISCRKRMNLTGAVADLEDLRVHLKLRRLTLAGHSWGGMLSMAYTQAHPDCVAGLLLIDTGPMSKTAFAAEDAVVQNRLTAEERSALLRAERAKEDEPHLEEIARGADFADRANEGRLTQSIPKGEPLFYGAVSELLGADLGRWDVSEGMRKTHVPLALVFGRQDPGFFIAGQMREVQPQSKLMVIEKAGHYPWLENQSATADALKSSIEQLFP